MTNISNKSAMHVSDTSDLQQQTLAAELQQLEQMLEEQQGAVCQLQEEIAHLFAIEQEESDVINRLEHQLEHAGATEKADILKHLQEARERLQATRAQLQGRETRLTELQGDVARTRDGIERIRGQVAFQLALQQSLAVDTAAQKRYEARSTETVGAQSADMVRERKQVSIQSMQRAAAVQANMIQDREASSLSADPISQQELENTLRVLEQVTIDLAQAALDTINDMVAQGGKKNDAEADEARQKALKTKLAIALAAASCSLNIPLIALLSKKMHACLKQIDKDKATIANANAAIGADRTKLQGILDKMSAITAGGMANDVEQLVSLLKQVIAILVKGNLNESDVNTLQGILLQVLSLVQDVLAKVQKSKGEEERWMTTATVAQSEMKTNVAVTNYEKLSDALRNGAEMKIIMTVVKALLIALSVALAAVTGGAMSILLAVVLGALMLSGAMDKMTEALAKAISHDKDPPAWAKAVADVITTVITVIATLGTCAAEAAVAQTVKAAIESAISAIANKVVAAISTGATTQAVEQGAQAAIQEAVATVVENVTAKIVQNVATRAAQEGLDVTATQALEGTLTQTVRETAEVALKDAVQKSVEAAVKNGVETAVQKAVEKSMSEGIGTALKSVLTASGREALKQVAAATARQVVEDTAGEVAQSAAQQITESVNSMTEPMTVETLQSTIRDAANTAAGRVISALPTVAGGGFRAFASSIVSRAEENYATIGAKKGLLWTGVVNFMGSNGLVDVTTMGYMIKHSKKELEDSNTMQIMLAVLEVVQAIVAAVASWQVVGGAGKGAAQEMRSFSKTLFGMDKMKLSALIGALEVGAQVGNLYGNLEVMETHFNLSDAHQRLAEVERDMTLYNGIMQNWAERNKQQDMIGTIMQQETQSMLQTLATSAEMYRRNAQLIA